MKYVPENEETGTYSAKCLRGVRNLKDDAVGVKGRKPGKKTRLSGLFRNVLSLN